jgi:signal transduction histidine kinase
MRAQERQHFESLNRMKDEFIRMAAHDLRNPLNVILGSVRMLDRLEVAERNHPLLQQASENIQKSVDKMRTLVTVMLDLAQLETGSPLTLTPSRWGFPGTMPEQLTRSPVRNRSGSVRRRRMSRRCWTKTTDPRDRQSGIER